MKMIKNVFFLIITFTFDLNTTHRLQSCINQVSKKLLNQTNRLDTSIKAMNAEDVRTSRYTNTFMFSRVDSAVKTGNDIPFMRTFGDNFSNRIDYRQGSTDIGHIC